MQTHKGRPTVSYSFTMQLTYPNRIGMFASIVQTIGKHGGDLGAVDIVSADNHRMARDITVQARDEEHVEEIVQSITGLADVKMTHFMDRVFQLHRGGKISTQSKVPLSSRETLSMAYTPGVARVCQAIAADPGRASELTIKANSVGVVSDGTAVLGLGDIGPEAAMPVMEGKAMLFKEFAGIDAYPICLRTKDPVEIVETVSRMAVGFGGINLEDISAPRCFEIEEKLQAQLDIPVFHDDQHGTAVVVLAALVNALRLSERNLHETRIVICGAGAAGCAIAKILLTSGAKDIVICDRQGILHAGRAASLNASKRWLAEHTNPGGQSGSVGEALQGADVFIGVSGPGCVQAEALRRMAPRALVFALANPVPEIMPEEAGETAFIVATGRSDYPNQINNVLAFPGIFRGALNVRARCITEEMKLAAAYAIAGCIPLEELSPEYIIPSAFNGEVVKRVAAAVQTAAYKGGVAGRKAERCKDSVEGE